MDLMRIEERIAVIKALIKKGGEGYATLCRRLAVLKDERDGLLDSLHAMEDYVNEVERRKKGAA